MATIVTNYIFSMLVVFSAFSISNAIGCEKIQPQLENEIIKKAKGDNGSEYCEYRNIYIIKSSVFVSYSVEGPCFNNTDFPKGTCGNYHIRYLAAFHEGKIIPSVKIGDRNTFTDRNLDLHKNELKISGVTRGSDDPLCCPSAPQEISLTIVNGVFVEQFP